MPLNIVYQENSATVVKGKDRPYVTNRKGGNLLYMCDVYKENERKMPMVPKRKGGS